MAPDLLVRHEAREPRHEAEVAHPGSEGDEHERPATPQAEQAVVPAEAECGRHAAPVVGEEVGGGVPAGLEAAVLQRAELEGAGHAQDGGEDERRVAVEPWPRVDRAVHRRVEAQRGPAECRPQGDVAAGEHAEHEAGARLTGAADPEQPGRGSGTAPSRRRGHRRCAASPCRAWSDARWAPAPRRRPRRRGRPDRPTGHRADRDTRRGLRRVVRRWPPVVCASTRPRTPKPPAGSTAPPASPSKTSGPPARCTAPPSPNRADRRTRRTE